MAAKQRQDTPPDRLRQVQLLASIVGLAVGVTTLLVGVRNFNHNAEAQLQLSALNTLQHYFDLAIQHPELATREDDQPVDARYAWFAAQALTTAQTLRALVGHQESWQRAINGIIRQHRSFLRSGAFVCDDFTPDFISYLRERVAELRCAPPWDASGPDALPARGTALTPVRVTAALTTHPRRHLPPAPSLAGY